MISSWAGNTTLPSVVVNFEKTGVWVFVLNFPKYVSRGVCLSVGAYCIFQKRHWLSTVGVIDIINEKEKTETKLV
jgi:hypothetical protein